MTKEEEIKHLMALMGKGCGDTYFNQFFSICDIEKMIENIKSDFAIECGCTFSKKADIFKKQLHAWRKAHDQDMLDLVESMLVTDDQGGDALDVATKKIGIANTIKIKRKNKIALSEEEIDYLVSRL